MHDNSSSRSNLSPLGVWIHIRDALQCYRASPLWNSQLEDLLLRNANNQPRNLFDNVTRPFYDDNGE